MASTSGRMTEPAYMQYNNMIEHFKHECGMNDKDWYKFCLRYSTRNISTILSFFEDLYGGHLPYGFITALKEELTKGARRKV